MVGTADSVLIREVSLIQSVLYREVPLYYYIHTVHIIAWSAPMKALIEAPLSLQPASLDPKE